jgi:hypothetical protein
MLFPKNIKKDKKTCTPCQLKEQDHILATFLRLSADGQENGDARPSAVFGAEPPCWTMQKGFVTVSATSEFSLWFSRLCSDGVVELTDLGRSIKKSQGPRVDETRIVDASIVGRPVHIQSNVIQNVPGGLVGRPTSAHPCNALSGNREHIEQPSTSSMPTPLHGRSG